MLLKREGRRRPGIKVVGGILLLVSIAAMLGGCAWLQDLINPPPANGNVDNNPPTAVIQSSTTSGTAPLTVTFDASSSFDPDGDILKCTWLFGDGAVSDETTPTHTYSNSGSFTVTLIVEDEIGAEDTSSIAIEIMEPPLALLKENSTQTNRDGEALLQFGDSVIPVKVSVASNNGKPSSIRSAERSDLSGITIHGVEIGDVVVFVTEDQLERFYPNVMIESNEKLARNHIRSTDKTEWVYITLLAVVDWRKAAVQVAEKAAIWGFTKACGNITINYVDLDFKKYKDEIIELATTGVHGRFLLLWPNTLGPLGLMDLHDTQLGTLYYLADYGGFETDFLTKLKEIGEVGRFVYAARKGKLIKGSFTLIGVYPKGEIIVKTPRKGVGPMEVVLSHTVTVPGGKPETTLIEWDFGDGKKEAYRGTEIPDEDIHHTYSKPGEYTITLSVTSFVRLGDSQYGEKHALKSENSTRIVVESSVAKPQNTTSPATNIASTSATLNGTLDSTGGEECQVWFEYGQSSSYGYSTNKETRSSTGQFTRDISELKPDTIYHFRACASNSKGTTRGSDVTFTVSSAVPTLSVSLVATPSNGPAPLDVSLKATVSGTATGTINYTFYANRSDSGTNITSGWAAKFDGVTNNPKTATLNYSSSGTYTAKVIVERGSAPPVEARVTIMVQSSQRELVVNGSFSSGSSGWTLVGDFWAGTNYSHYRTSPGYAAGGVTSAGQPENSAVGWMYQNVTIPSGATSATLSFYYNITSQETSAHDFLNVTIQDSAGHYLGSVRLLSNRDQASLGVYRRVSADVTSYRGQTIRVNFLATTNDNNPTVFRIDDVSLMSDG